MKVPSFFAFAVAIAPLTTNALAASSVDGSIDELAVQIVERTRTDGTPTIGISTFTHSDGTCSDLSDYVTEFIVDSLFNAGEGKVDIIERSQLSAIFREMEMVFDGTIAPDAAKRLGEIEDVDALITGSLIQFGEQVKIQARMISTENGRLFATARSEFPSVGSVAQMMAMRSRLHCGFSGETGAALGSAPQQSTAAVPAEASNGAHRGLVEPSRRFSSDVFDAEVSSLIYSKSSGDTSFAVRFKNTSENSIAISYVPKSLSVSDGAGGFMEYKANWSGVRTCYNATSLQYCNSSNPAYATTVGPGKVAQLNFLMQASKDIGDPAVTLAFELVVTPNVDERDSYSVQSVGFYDMLPDSK